jgi:hypothetical protein
MTVYSFKVKGEGESSICGARPEDLKPLIEKPDKDNKSLIHMAVKAQVELAVQAGDVNAAWRAIEKNQEAQFIYSNPLNVFQKDAHNGNYPFIGAHSIVACFRDSAKFLFPGKIFYDKKGSKNPAAQHARKAISVRPYHVFMKRKGKTIQEPDKVEGQQPSPTVRGFSRFETIDVPWEFEFTITVSTENSFAGTPLKDKTAIKKILNQMQIQGLGGRRGAGYGQWMITDLKEMKI